MILYLRRKKLKKNQKGSNINLLRISSFFDRVLSSIEKKPRYYKLFSVFFIFVIGFVAYHNIFDNSFHFDDTVWQSMEQLKNHDYLGLKDFNIFRVIPFASLIYNHHTFGETTAGYYIINLSIHILNSIIVFGILLQLFKTTVVNNAKYIKYSLLLSLFGALVFLLHPIQTQTVCYIYQRLASIVSFFYLLSLYFYIKARLSETKSNKMLFFSLGFIAMIAAFFSKENAFTLPVAVILIEIFFFRDSFKINIKYFIIALFIIISIILGVNYLSTYSIGSFFAEQISYQQEMITPTNYLLTQLSVVIQYWRMLILPYGLHVDHNVVLSVSFFELRTLLGFLVNLIVFISSIIIFKKNRLLSFGIIFFYLTLSIESSVIPIKDLLFEHRLYLPMLGFVVILISIIMKLITKKKVSIIYLLIFLSAILVFYSILSYSRSRVWDNDGTLWTDVIRKSPMNARARLNRGVFFLKKDRYDLAIHDFNKAIELLPSFTTAYSNRGIAYFYLNEYHKSLSDFNKALETDGQNIKKYFELNKSYYRTAKLDMEVKNASVYLNRANVYVKLDSFSLALDDLLKLKNLIPESIEIYMKIGYCYQNIGDYNKAIENYLIPLEKDQFSPFTYSNLSNCYVEINEFEKAIETLEKGIQANPNEINLVKNKEYLINKFDSLRNK